MRIVRFLPAALFLLPSACGTDPLVPTSGSLEVTTATTGDQPDPDGYTVQLDSEQPRTIGTTANLDPIEVVPGDHIVTLGGLAANCGVAGENPRPVSVFEANTSTVAFEVTCSSGQGAVRVRTITRGVDLDSDGYIVSGDGVSSRSIGVGAVLTIAGVLAASIP
jgi:hypothetical protein